MSLLFMSFAAFIYSVKIVIDLRTESQRLTTQKKSLEGNIRTLRDKNHNLVLEIAAQTEFSRIHSGALEQGMVEPALEDGNLIYLTEERP